MPKRYQDNSSDTEVDELGAYVRSANRPCHKTRRHGDVAITVSQRQIRRAFRASSEDPAHSTSTELGSVLELDSEGDSFGRESSPCAVDDSLERQWAKSSRSPSPFPHSTYWSDPTGKAKDHREYGEMIKKRSESESDCDADDEFETQPSTKKSRPSPSPVRVMRAAHPPPPLSTRALCAAAAVQSATSSPKPVTPGTKTNGPIHKRSAAPFMERTSSAESESSIRTSGVRSMTAGFENLKAGDEDTEMMETDTESEDDRSVSASLHQLPLSPSPAAPTPAPTRLIRPLPVRQPGRPASQPSHLASRRKLKRTRESLARQDDPSALTSSLVDDDEMVTSEVEREMQNVQRNGPRTAALPGEDVDCSEPGQPSAKIRRVEVVLSSTCDRPSSTPVQASSIPEDAAMVQQARDRRAASRVRATLIRRLKRDAGRRQADRARLESRPQIEFFPPPSLPVFQSFEPLPVAPNFEDHGAYQEIEEIVEVTPFRYELYALEAPEEVEDVGYVAASGGYHEEELYDSLEDELASSVEDEDLVEPVDDSDDAMSSIGEPSRPTTPIPPPSPVWSDAPPAYPEVPPLVPSRMSHSITRRVVSLPQVAPPEYDLGNPVAGGEYSRRSPPPCPPFNAQTDCQSIIPPRFDPVPSAFDTLMAPVPTRHVGWLPGVLNEGDDDVLPAADNNELSFDDEDDDDFVRMPAAYPLASPARLPLPPPAQARFPSSLYRQHEVEVERLVDSLYDAGLTFDAAVDLEEGQWDDDDVDGALGGGTEEEESGEEVSGPPSTVLGTISRLVRNAWRW